MFRHSTFVHLVYRTDKFLIELTQQWECESRSDLCILDSALMVGRTIYCAGSQLLLCQQVARTFRLLLSVVVAVGYVTFRIGGRIICLR